MLCVEESSRIAPAINARTTTVGSPLRVGTACDLRPALSISRSGSRLQRKCRHPNWLGKIAADRRFSNVSIERSYAYAALVPTGSAGRRCQHRLCRKCRSCGNVRRQGLAECSLPTRGVLTPWSCGGGEICMFPQLRTDAPYWRLPEADTRSAIPVGSAISGVKR